MFLFVILLLMIVLIAVVLSKTTPENNRRIIRPQTVQSKGEAAEKAIVSLLEEQAGRGLPGIVMRNLYIPKGERETTEIDVLFISCKGLFVIESKNYAGYIFGNDQERYWTVSLYAGSNSLGQKETEKHQFYNPVWQNRMHVKSLIRLFDGYVPVYSLVVFSDRGTFSNLNCYSDDVDIVQYGALAQYFVIESVTLGWISFLRRKCSRYTSSFFPILRSVSRSSRSIWITYCRLQIIRTLVPGAVGNWFFAQQKGAQISVIAFMAVPIIPNAITREAFKCFAFYFFSTFSYAWRAVS